MMVGGAQASRSGRKSLDAEVNLVPFIDLLSMCICFLLMTAVWIEIGAVQIKQSRGTNAPAPARNQTEMELKFGGADSLSVVLKRGGRPFKKLGLKARTADVLIAQLDTALTAWFGAASTKAQPVSAAMVTPAAGVSYGNLVSVMDTLRKHQIINLGVTPVGGPPK